MRCPLSFHGGASTRGTRRRRGAQTNFVDGAAAIQGCVAGNAAPGSEAASAGTAAAWVVAQHSPASMSICEAHTCAIAAPAANSQSSSAMAATLRRCWRRLNMRRSSDVFDDRGRHAPALAWRVTLSLHFCKDAAVLHWGAYNLIGVIQSRNCANYIRRTCPDAGGFNSQEERSMKRLMASLIVAAFASLAFAGVARAADVAQPETPGSAGPKAAAETKHLAKKHGLKNAKQPEAQTPGSERAQAAAEAKHLKKKHGKVNDSADKRLEMDHPNH